MGIINKFIGYFGYQIVKKQPFLRPCIQYIKDNSQGASLTGVEIGVFEGDHAKRILQELNINTLHLIDPYKAYDGYEDEMNNFHTKQENLINAQTLRTAETKAHTTLVQYLHKIEFIKEKSEDIVDEFTDESLDFVYIDGSHRYEEVKKDMTFWFSKVKPGGVMGGHNIQNHENGDGTNGVPQAVAEFAVKFKLKLNIGREDWWFVR